MYLYIFDNTNATSMTIYQKIVNNGLYEMIKLVNSQQYKNFLPAAASTLPLIIEYESPNHKFISDIDAINDIIDKLIETKKDNLTERYNHDLDEENQCMYSNMELNSFANDSNDILKLNFEDSDLKELTSSKDVESLINERRSEMNIPAS